LTISLLRDHRGQPLQLTLIEDVTEKKLIAESLEASEVRFARLAESGLLGVAFESEDRTITEANEAFLQMLGSSRARMLAEGLSLDERTPAEFHDVDARARRELATSGFCRTYEKEFCRLDGGRVSVLVGASSSGSSRRGAVWFAIDITERARALGELRESLKARDDFLAAAAHELRTPLTPIQLQVENLLDRARAQGARSVDPHWLQQQLEPIERAAARLGKLLDTLLVVSRLTVGNLPLEREEVDLAQLVQSVADRMRFDLDRAGCELSIEGMGRAATGHWDRARLEEVLRQILSNALRYGKGRPIEITVGLDGDVASVSVRDHGVGIAPEVQDRLFQRFERLAPLRNYGGLGLGLWFARRIVEAHGETIRLWSRPGEGSRFTLELPCRPAPSPSDERRARS